MWNQLALKCLLILAYVLHVLQQVNGATFTNMKAVNNDLSVAAAHVNMHPVAQTTDTLNVMISWNIVSINDFDESNGYIEIGGFFTMSWLAAGYPDTSSYGVGADTILYSKIWTPPLMILNSLTYGEEIGHQAQTRVRYNFNNKACLWTPWLITRIGCSPNVQYYPYDKQSCKMRVSVWGYESSEVNLTIGDTAWTFDYFEENGEWMIDSTSVSYAEVEKVAIMTFTIDITRRPTYYLIILVFPVILLGVLNSCSFLLPTASGERIGYSVTCFLSYVVLLNMIMDFLPTSASPMSYLSYYTFIMMVFSGSVILVTILTISIYHKQEARRGKPVPKILQTLYLFFTCKICKKMKKSTNEVSPIGCQKVEPMQPDDAETNTVTLTEVDGDVKIREVWDEESVSMATVEDDDDELTWETLANFLDWLFFFGFLCAQLIYSFGYLLPIFVQ